MNKLIRNIPDDVVVLLREHAKAQGLPLESYMRMKLIEVARKQQEQDKTPERVEKRKGTPL